jgi:hypothetical protein
MEDEILPMILDEWVARTIDSWTSNVGHTYLGTTTHYICADWKIHSLCVDSELLEGITVSQ